ncbi:Leucine rich repeat containing protein BspA family protein [Entamoeba marina]
MQSKSIDTNFKKVDSYSMLICSKYLQSPIDFINLMCVCKKFKETTEKLRFNPIPIKSLKLFPKIQTQYLYSKDDTKIKGIEKYEIWYTVNYNEYNKLYEENIKFHIVKYLRKHEIQNYGIIPFGVTEICESLLTITNVKELIIPSTVKKLCNYCFNDCTSLTTINIPSLITSIPEVCFQNCLSLKSMNIPNSVTSFGDFCFNKCKSLTSINIPSLMSSIPRSCFQYCSNLQSIKIPNSVTSFGDKCFKHCVSLSNIILPTSLIEFGIGCFSNCTQLINILEVTEHCF